MGPGSGYGSGADPALGTSPLSSDGGNSYFGGGDDLQRTVTDHITGCRRLPCTECDGEEENRRAQPALAAPAVPRSQSRRAGVFATL